MEENDSNLSINFTTIIFHIIKIIAFFKLINFKFKRYFLYGFYIDLKKLSNLHI